MLLWWWLGGGEERKVIWSSLTYIEDKMNYFKELIIATSGSGGMIIYEVVHVFQRHLGRYASLEGLQFPP